MAMSLNYTAAPTKGGSNFLFEGLELSQTTRPCVVGAASCKVPVQGPPVPTAAGAD